jgi:2-polyprenyl-3-methyl-5-hydroxy-6-metoxy-1,4-benzoquinol methylase
MARPVPRILHTVESQATAVSLNERHEAAAFDRLAERSDARSLETSAWTFRRYRRATQGHPIFNAHPDIVFTQLGRLCQAAAVRALDKPLQGLRILDLGAGDGSYSVILAEQGADVTSIEISPRQVELARGRMAIHGLAWYARVASAYDLADVVDRNSFDVVFGQGILHHLTLDVARVYEGVNKVLKCGGFAVFTEPYSGSRFLRSAREALAWLVPLDKESPEERPLVASDLQPLGGFFENVEYEFSDLFERLARRVFRWRQLGITLFTVDRLLLRAKPLRCLAGRVHIVARKSADSSGRGTLSSGFQH